MSQMSTVPVFACRVCGKPVYVTSLRTIGEDPDGKLLETLMKGLSDVALCPEHRRQWNYFASRNRADEFYSNLFNPQGVLYNIRPGLTGVDWYGRGWKGNENGN